MSQKRKHDGDVVHKLAAEVVEEEPIDDTYCQPDTWIKKTWVVRNIGSSRWPKETIIRFANVEPYDRVEREMKTIVDCSVDPIKPGQETTISVDMNIPTHPGQYQYFWALRNGVTHKPFYWLYAIINVV